MSVYNKVERDKMKAEGKDGKEGKDPAPETEEDLAVFVEKMLKEMQDKFDEMSKTIITK